MSACPECGRIHCERCTKKYAEFSMHMDIARYWEAEDGVSHIVVKQSERVLCSGDLFRVAERIGRVPVQYGLRAS